MKKITVRELKRLIQEQILQESTKFTATRRLTILARKASMDFEEDIVNELGLMKPDDMDEASQKVYYHAMKKLEASFIGAVVDTVKEVLNLPKEEDEAAAKALPTQTKEPATTEVPTIPDTLK